MPPHLARSLVAWPMKSCECAATIKSIPGGIDAALSPPDAISGTSYSPACAASLSPPVGQYGGNRHPGRSRKARNTSAPNHFDRQ